MVKRGLISSRAFEAVDPSASVRGLCVRLLRSRAGCARTVPGRLLRLLTPPRVTLQPGFNELQLDSQLVFNWNQVFWGATTLLAKLTNAGAYHQLVRSLPPRSVSSCLLFS